MSIAFSTDRSGFRSCTGALLAVALFLSMGHAHAEMSQSGFVKTDTDAEFFPFAVDQDKLLGAPDQSVLNRAIDASARLFVRDGHFFRVGPDLRAGTADDVRVRLFGANLAFGANFPDEAGALRLARNLRKLGFNAVRLHHLDSLPSDEMREPYSILLKGTYPTLNPVAVERLRFLVKALAGEGLYVNLNLHVGYRFRPEVDGLPALDGNAPMPPVDAPIHVYKPRLIDAQEKYAREVIRALGLKDNPALALVEINNESSLLSSWRGARWREAIPSAYAPQLQRLWREWLLRRYSSLSTACAAWGGCKANSTTSLVKRGDSEASDIDLPDPVRQNEVAANGFEELKDGVARRMRGLSASLFGESPESPLPPRERDFLQFLAATDKAYFDRIRRIVQEETDERVPVTGTQMAFGGVLNFDSEVGMDYIDEHIYVSHPVYPSADGDPQDWRIANRSASGDEMDRLLALSLRRDGARPFVVSEFSMPYPNPRGAEMLPLMSLIGALQDWDGLFFFDYSDSANVPKAPSRFSLSGDWGTYVLTGQAAEMFRTNEIKPLGASKNVPLGPEDRLSIGADRRPDALEKWLEAKRGVKPCLAWQMRLALQPLLKQSDVIATTKTSEKSNSCMTANEYSIPDGNVRYDADAGRLTLQSPRIFGMFGATGAKRIGQGAAWLLFDPAGPGHASVLLTSRDGLPLSQSRNMLLSIGSLTAGAQPGSSPQRPKQIIAYRGDRQWLTLEPDSGSGKPSGIRVTRAPTWMLRTPFELGLSARRGKAMVYPLDGAGRRGEPLPSSDVSTGDDGVIVRLQVQGNRASPWYEIVYTE